MGAECTTEAGVSSEVVLKKEKEQEQEQQQDDGEEDSEEEEEKMKQLSPRTWQRSLGGSYEEDIYAVYMCHAGVADLKLRAGRRGNAQWTRPSRSWRLCAPKALLLLVRVCVRHQIFLCISCHGYICAMYGNQYVRL